MTNKTTTDILGFAAVAQALGGWALIFATILCLGDCGGCIDVVEIVRAARGCG